MADRLLVGTARHFRWTFGSSDAGAASAAWLHAARAARQQSLPERLESRSIALRPMHDGPRCKVVSRPSTCLLGSPAVQTLAEKR